MASATVNEPPFPAALCARLTMPLRASSWACQKLSMATPSASLLSSAAAIVFDFVGLLPEVVPDGPFAGAAAFGLAVAEMQAALDCAPIRFVSALELCPGFPAFEIRVPDPPRHGLAPGLLAVQRPSSNTAETGHVQRTSNIPGRTGLDKDKWIWAICRVFRRIERRRWTGMASVAALHGGNTGSSPVGRATAKLNQTNIFWRCRECRKRRNKSSLGR